MNVINGEGINIIGAVFLRLGVIDKKTGQIARTAVMAHLSVSTKRFYLSHQAMRELGIIPCDFPQISSN